MREKNTGIPINQEEIQHYLKDIRKIKVMTPEREKELAEMMKSEHLTESKKAEIEKERKMLEEMKIQKLQQSDVFDEIADLQRSDSEKAGAFLI